MIAFDEAQNFSTRAEILLATTASSTFASVANSEIGWYDFGNDGSRPPLRITTILQDDCEVRNSRSKTSKG